MKSKWRSRTVYVATIAAMSMMVAGFALASGLFPLFGATTVSGNQGAISMGDTIYQPGITGSLFTTASSSCPSPTSSSSGTPPVVMITGWVAGGAGACSAVTDYVLQLDFTSAEQTATGTYTDSFVVSSAFGQSGPTYTYNTGSVTIGCVVSENPSYCEAVINIDTGFPVSGAQPSVDAVDITVTGS